MIAPDLLAILVCPADRQQLDLQGTTLVCKQCGRRYPILDGIPIMLIEEGDKGKARAEQESRPAS